MRSALSQYGSITTLGCPPTGVGGVISRNLPSSSAVSASGHITTNTYGDFYSSYICVHCMMRLHALHVLVWYWYTLVHAVQSNQ
jgi:hypothetical protein